MFRIFRVVWLLGRRGAKYSSSFAKVSHCISKQCASPVNRFHRQRQEARSSRYALHNQRLERAVTCVCFSGGCVRPLKLDVRGPFVTPQQIVAVTLRLFALWLGIEALKTVPAFFTVRGFDAPSYVWMSLMLALTLIAIFALWFFPTLIAGKLLPRSNTLPQLGTTPDVWLALGCTLLGLWVLVTTLPHLVFDLIALKSAGAQYEDRSQLRDWALYYAVEVAISVWLLLGAKGVRKLFHWAQNAGITKDL